MPAPPSLNNYDLAQNTDVSYNALGMCDNNGDRWSDLLNGDRSRWNEMRAWLCNQIDNCDGFTVTSDDAKSFFYLKSWNSNATMKSKPTSVNTQFKTYYKKGRVKKAVEADTTNDPSILSNPATKIQLGTQASVKYNTTGNSGPQAGGGGYENAFQNDGQASTANYPSSYVGRGNGMIVPLGWRVLASCCSSHFRGGGSGAKWFVESGNGTYANSGTGWSGDWDNTILIENRGFDVDLHWSDMVSLGVDPDDEKRIKYRWCDQLDLPGLMSNKLRCTPALRQSTDASDSTLGFDTKLVNLCLADTSNPPAWINNADVLLYLKSVVRNNHDTEGKVATLFQTYCRGSPLASASKATGGNRTNAICSCINVSDFGYQGTSNCFDAPMKTYPGCADFTDQGQTFLGVVTRIGPIVSMPDNPEKSSAINAMGNNPACIAGACSWAEQSNNRYLSPYKSTCPAMAVQICSQTVNIGVAQSSPVNTSCHQSQTVTVTNNYGGNTPATTTVGGNGTTSMNSPSPVASPSPSPSPQTSLPFPWLEKYLDTSKKQYGAIAGCIIIMLICCFLVLAVVLMGGDDEEKGGSNLAAILAAQSFGRRAT